MRFGKIEFIYRFGENKRGSREGTVHQFWDKTMTAGRLPNLGALKCVKTSLRQAGATERSCRPPWMPLYSQEEIIVKSGAFTKLYFFRETN